MAYSFYWYFRPLAIIGKVFGAFPFQYVISSNPDKLKFQFFSLSHLYSVILYFTALGFFVYCCTHFITILFTMDTFLAAVMILIFIRSFVCFTFSTFNWKTLPRLIQLLDTFDREKENVLMYKSYGLITSCIIRMLIPSIIMLFFLSFMFAESKFLFDSVIPLAVQPTFYGLTPSILFSAISCWQILPLLLYYYFTAIVITFFRNVNYTLKMQLRNLVKSKPGDMEVCENMASKLPTIRYLHYTLAECVSEMSNCFGNFMATDRVCIITMMVLNVATFFNGSNQNAHLLILTAINFVLVLSVIYTSDEIKHQAAETIQYVHGLSFQPMNHETEQEVRLFLMQQIVRPVEISAAGYYIIDKTEILNITAAVATYLVALIQFINDARYRNCMFPTMSNTSLSGI